MTCAFLFPKYGAATRYALLGVYALCVGYGAISSIQYAVALPVFLGTCLSLAPCGAGRPS